MYFLKRNCTMWQAVLANGKIMFQSLSERRCRDWIAVNNFVDDKNLPRQRCAWFVGDICDNGVNSK